MKTHTKQAIGLALYAITLLAIGHWYILRVMQ